MGEVNSAQSSPWWWRTEWINQNIHIYIWWTRTLSERMNGPPVYQGLWRPRPRVLLILIRALPWWGKELHLLFDGKDSEGQSGKASFPRSHRNASKWPNWNLVDSPLSHSWNWNGGLRLRRGGTRRKRAKQTLQLPTWRARGPVGAIMHTSPPDTAGAEAKCSRPQGVEMRHGPRVRQEGAGPARGGDTTHGGSAELCDHKNKGSSAQLDQWGSEENAQEQACG